MGFLPEGADGGVNVDDICCNLQLATCLLISAGGRPAKAGQTQESTREFPISVVFHHFTILILFP